MSVTIQTIPGLLVQARGNFTEVARMLGVHRATVRKYHRDTKCEQHAVINGTLMLTSISARGARKKAEPCQPA
ncbi:protein ninH [Chimaeribacter arupi]|uniref:protein ninH n=1 Tax=Chimaeribacter arupi TaxID=2060066 RepID=UPI002711DEE2|nr:protein ninH [Chimaeribacter arupi]WKZ93594.1 protein ninH [Chimaeribacter arupi]